MNNAKMKDKNLSIEQLLQKLKKGSDFFQPSSHEYIVDITLITQHLQKKYPHLFERFKKPNKLQAVVQTAYTAIYKQNKRKYKSRLLSFSNRKNILPHSAGHFEKNFKDLIKTQGIGASPLFTAHTMISTMDFSQKSNLNAMFLSMGIKNQNQLSNLLSKWKSEALTPQKIKKQPLDYELGR